MIEDAAIPVCMVGLLYALPNTQLTRRLAREGRLYPEPDVIPKGNVDQCTHGLNFETLRPKQEILLDYKRVLEKIYDPIAFAGRLRRLVGPARQFQTQAPNPSRRCSAQVRRLRKSCTGSSPTCPSRATCSRQTFPQCLTTNPRSARWIVALMALYLHLGPFSRYVIEQIEKKIEEIERDGFDPRRGPSNRAPELESRADAPRRSASVQPAAF